MVADGMKNHIHCTQYTDKIISPRYKFIHSNHLYLKRSMLLPSHHELALVHKGRIYKIRLTICHVAERDNHRESHW